MSRLTFNLDIDFFETYEVLTSYLYDLFGTKVFTEKDLENQLLTSNKSKVFNKENTINLLPKLIKFGFLNKLDNQNIRISNIGILLSEANNPDEKMNLYLEILNDYVVYEINNEKIRPFAYINTLFRDLKGTVSKLELLSLMFITCWEDNESLLESIYSYHKTKIPNYMTNFIKELLKTKKIYEEDIVLAEKDLNKITNILHKISFIHDSDKTSEYKIKITPEVEISPLETFELTQKGYEYIFGKESTEVIAESLGDPDNISEDEKSWEINNREPELDKNSPVVKFKRDHRVIKKSKDKGLDICFFEEIETKYGHPKPPVGKKEEPCIEVHHVVPMRFQKEFSINLDQTPLTICVCMVCHKILHHGSEEERKMLVSYLYQRKKTVLKEILGINNFNQFKRFYEL